MGQMSTYFEAKIGVYIYSGVVYYVYMAKYKRSKKWQPRRTLASHLLAIVSLALFVGLAGVMALILGTKLPQPCANSISCIKDLSGAYEPQQEGVFMGKKVLLPAYLARNPVPNQVLGESSASKHIFVDLANQKLLAYEGDKLVFNFPVSTGKWGRTPTGDFRIWIKLAFTRMTGGAGADYYDLPNVPHVMFFYNNEVSKGRGYSIHGAYWHNNFGHTMSHGCVNMRPEDAAKIYDWASPPTEGNVTYASENNPGTLITIFGQSPM